MRQVLTSERWEGTRTLASARDSHMTRRLKAGAASRPIAGKRGSHGYCAGPEAGCISVGDSQPIGLRCRAENKARERAAYPVGAGLPAMRQVKTTERWDGARVARQ